MKKSLFLAAALAALLSSSLAFGGHRAKASGPSYPMKADEFKALVEKRIDKVREAVDKKLDRSGVSPDRKKAIHKMLDEEAKPIRAEVAKAAAHGTVTQADGDKVKTLTGALRGHLRDRMAAEKKGLKAEGKDGKDPKGAKAGKVDPKGAKEGKQAGGGKADPKAGKLGKEPAKAGKEPTKNAKAPAKGGKEPSNKAAKAAPKQGGKKSKKGASEHAAGGATAV